MSKSTKITRLGNIYFKNIITKEVLIPFNNVGDNIEEILKEKIKHKYEGKCIPEGYIKKNSSRIITYSCGVINANSVKYTVAFECDVCNPVEGMLIQCKCIQITKAGIRAVYVSKNESDVSPVNIFVAREHHVNSNILNKTKENDLIKIKVIGIRYELNDSYIAILGEIKEIIKVNKPKLKTIQ